MKLFDVVALLTDLSELGLYRGQVGTIVEEYEPGVFEVEFSDTHGRAYALETLPADRLMVLHHQPIHSGVLV
jgi:membrane protein implicated in regulation of membrane protease activity